MKISAFTFIRNGHMLGFPFEESIRSALPLVDEFIVAMGASQDDTEARLRAIRDPKLRIIPTTWNERIRSDLGVKGFVYGQQKSIALFNCTGDWAFYLEGDELIHEDDIPKIRASMERHLDNPRVEALYFRYLHFYGNGQTLASSPAWYRREVRVLRNTIPAWAPKGLFFITLTSPKGGRYPRAADSDGTIYHYGWVRSEQQMIEKFDQVAKFWPGKKPEIKLDEIDPGTLKPFTGTHPAAIRAWLPPATGLFQANPNHVLTRRERKNRWVARLERLTGGDFSKRHFYFA